MKISYDTKNTIIEVLDRLIYEAEYKNKPIIEIKLNPYEWVDFAHDKRWQFMVNFHPYCRETTYRGVRIVEGDMND